MYRTCVASEFISVENAADLFALDQQIVGPFQIRRDIRIHLLNRRLYRKPCRQRDHKYVRRRQRWTKNHRTINSCRALRYPRVRSASPAGRLLFRQENTALGAPSAAAAIAAVLVEPILK